jgi:hypothetical protein
VSTVVESYSSLGAFCAKLRVASTTLLKAAPIPATARLRVGKFSMHFMTASQMDEECGPSIETHAIAIFNDKKMFVFESRKSL